MAARSRSTLALVVGILTVGISPPASAGLTICNQTREPTGIAIGTKQGGLWKSVGWWTIDPGRCKAVLKGRLTGRNYFLHALHYNVGGRWEGEKEFCIDRGSFSIMGRFDCIERGFKTARFLKIETKDKPDWQHTLTDDAATLAHGEAVRHPDLPEGLSNKQPEDGGK